MSKVAMLFQEQFKSGEKEVWIKVLTCVKFVNMLQASFKGVLTLSEHLGMGGIKGPPRYMDVLGPIKANLCYY